MLAYSTPYNWAGAIALFPPLLRAALPQLDAENAARRTNAQHLREAIADCPLVDIAQEFEDSEGIYHLMSLIWRGPKRKTSGLPRRDDAAQG